MAKRTEEADPALAAMARSSRPRPRYWTHAAAESPLSAFVPFSSLVTDQVAITRAGDYLRTWHLDGVSFECADPQDVATWHESKCNLLTLLGGGQLAVWEHRVQRRITDRLPAAVGPTFARELDEALSRRNCSRPLMSNELYLTLLYRPETQASRTFQPKARSIPEITRQQSEALASLDEKAQAVERILRDFEPSALGSYEQAGVRFSRLAEFFGFLVNGEWRRVRLESGPLYRTLPNTRLTFGGGVVELRSSAEQRYGALLDIQEYADTVEPGSLNSILYEDIEFIETQSFAVLNRRDALGAMKLQRNQLLASSDVVVSQVTAMDEALDGLGDGAFAMGEYHYSLMVLGNTPQEALQRSARAAAAIGEATGISLAPVDLVADAAWFAQMPGNFRWRTRQARISSRAFAALSCAHNFAHGKRDGNPWGPAVMLLRTPSGQPFYLNLHVSPEDEDAEHRKLPGNTMIIGVTGSGKTTLELAILASLTRFQPAPRQVIFDKDRSCEIYVRAMHGRYFSLEPGEPTGVNPFQRTVTPQRLVFWEALVRQCLHSESLPLLPSDQRAIHDAVAALASLPPPHRRMSTLRQNLPRDGDDSLYERLGRWCEGGALGWVFDHADDRLTQLEDASVIGFDYTGFLDDDEVRPALMMTLLNFMDELIDGRRIVYVMAEFWKAIGDPHFADFAKNHQKTIRKQNGLGIFDTQSPSDVLLHPIGRTMVEQSVTKIFLPNPDAVRSEYVDGFGLTDAEFERVKELRAQGGYRFLVKQNTRSTVCELDLSGMDEALTVLSGSTDNIALLDELRADLGDNPGILLPALHRAVAERRATGRTVGRIHRVTDLPR